MQLPKFLIADNAEYPENIYVVHTEKPRFILDIDTEEYAIMDNTEVNEEMMTPLLEAAYLFYDKELDKYEEEEEE
ncbi:MAG: hypothetical protein LUG18_10830 [Candidatus Azobacteroides sp.]|nr:hypothetical protein [Candidatus Azobacteroides sp.]